MIKSASFSVLSSFIRARCLAPISLQQNVHRSFATDEGSSDPPKKPKKEKKSKKAPEEEKKTPHQMRETSFLTLESDPTKHTEAHLYRFYVVPPQLQERLFTLGGFSTSQQLNHATLREMALMIRRPALEIMNCLRKADYSKPVIRYVICM